MNEVLVLMAAAYLFLAALVVLVLIRSPLRWIAKLGLIILMVAFSVLSYQQWMQAHGWPAQAKLPSRFLFHYAVVEEPNKKRGTEGRVFVFLSDLSGNRMADTPRAYELPYGKDLHQRVDGALRKIRNGNLQIGQVGGELFDPTQARDNTRVADKRSPIEFSDLPDPQLPEK